MLSFVLSGFTIATTDWQTALDPVFCRSVEECPTMLEVADPTTTHSLPSNAIAEGASTSDR